MLQVFNLALSLGIFFYLWGVKLVFILKKRNSKVGILSTKSLLPERSLKVLELKPFTTIAASAAVGIMIASGMIDPSQKEAVQSTLDTIFGGIIIVLTAGATLHRYVIKHPLPTPKSESPKESVSSHLDA